MTTPRSARWWAGLALAGLLAFTACGDDSDDAADAADEVADTDDGRDEDQQADDLAEVTRGEDVASPRVTGPVTGGERGMPFNPLLARLAEEYRYTEEEFFIAGEAIAYEPQGDWDEDGEWEASPTQTAPYETRMLVRRPADAEAFNGTVVVEWINVTSGDWDAGFSAAYEELLRGGYVWVGVSAQRASLEGGNLAPPAFDEPIALKTWDPKRYGDLTHPGDDYSYDIYSQAAQAIRRPDGVDPLDGLASARIIATGQSQSAWFMVTYVNAVHPIADIYDGFLLQARPFASGFGLSADTADALPDVARIRTDLSDPVMQFQTEADLFDLDFYPARQSDTARIRTWEVAGTAHVDQRMSDYWYESIREWNESFDLDLYRSGCGMNDGPQSLVLHAAWAALIEWVEGGDPPATAEPIEVEDEAIVRDRHGNALGGVRTPAVDAPISTLSPEGACPTLGSAMAFDEATLRSLYPTHEDYVDAVQRATQEAVDAGFLLPIDGERIIEEAELAHIPE